MMSRPRLTLLHVEIEASWRSLAVSLLTACGLIVAALWWVG